MHFLPTLSGGVIFPQKHLIPRSVASQKDIGGGSVPYSFFSLLEAVLSSYQDSPEVEK